MGRFVVLSAFAITILASASAAAAGFTTVKASAWNTAAVERVLHAFAYGGRVTDSQIRQWVSMGPAAAIQQMLTMEPNNRYLSPPISPVQSYSNSLDQLQTFLQSGNASNPMCPSARFQFDTYYTSAGQSWHSKHGLQRTWLAAAHLRGSNPFRHKVGFYLSNHLMATSIERTKLNLIRNLYDTAVDQLAAGRPLWEVLAEGAASAAVAMEYGHRFATYNNASGAFVGSDDFGREYHQLFFKIDGSSDGADYHETTTIKNTSRMLTGMGIDKGDSPPGFQLMSNELWIAPIDFTDHVDAVGTKINNRTLHHAASLEILSTTISGASAHEKIWQLSEVAIRHPDSLDNLPIDIISFFGDDNLNAEKIATIQEAWRSRVGTANDLLYFLRDYAISTTFHNPATYKYKTTFDQVVIPWNISDSDNDDFFMGGNTPYIELEKFFIEPFFPIHRIFGHQTGLVAANDSNLFRNVYNYSSSTLGYYDYAIVCKNLNGTVRDTWKKDWREMIPTDSLGRYRVGNVARWLWQRLTGDSGANYTMLERAHLAAILARQQDLGTVLDFRQPNKVYTAGDLAKAPLSGTINSLEQTELALASTNSVTRSDANRRVALAVSFIRATPFAFAMEGQ